MSTRQDFSRTEPASEGEGDEELHAATVGSEGGASQGLSTGIAPEEPDMMAGESPIEVPFDAPFKDEPLTSMGEKVRGFVLDKPLIAVAGAVAAGFIIGRLLSR